MTVATHKLSISWLAVRLIGDYAGNDEEEQR